MKKPWYMITIIFFLEIMIIFLLIPGNYSEKAVEEEKQLISKYLSEDTSNWVTQKATDWYQITMIDTGVYESMYRHLIPNDTEKARSKGMEELGRGIFEWVLGRLEAFTNIVYQFLARFAMFVMWFPYILIFLIPAMYDGLMVREIKKTNFRLASPVVHRYSFRMVGLLVFGLITLFFVPIAVNPIIIPFIMLGICVFLSFTVSNFQKRV